jgi:hypothetical protein
MLDLQFFAISASRGFKKVEEYFKTKNDERWKLPSSKAETPLRTSYPPELDLSPKLGQTEAIY